MGYLYRVGQSAARRYLRWSRRPDDLPSVPSVMEPLIEPALPLAIQRLRPSSARPCSLFMGSGGPTPR